VADFPLVFDLVTHVRYIYGVRPDEVLTVVRALHARNLRVWIDGGWGVDALLHEVTRAHDDVDLVVELNELPEVYECLSNLGFSVAEDLSPVRVVLQSPDSRQVDLHPVVFAEDGTGWQIGASPDGSDCAYPPEGFTIGRILDHVVPCLSAALQLEHHSGYPPRPRDQRDMTMLANRFGLDLPSPW
jgi:lincosamide nucleotidyltransferase A/C/D/E